jgi:DNA polymerase-3 subunit epsilon
MKQSVEDYAELAFVDIETTGSNFERDRITEIGIKTLVNDQVSAWESLIDPQTFIPANIQRLTGISPAMLSGQPTFEDLADEIQEALSGKIFVAHNARFDYGFLKASFKRMGIDFRPKVLCTVKLSRLLFPQQPRHNLDTIVATHQLFVSARHRAMGDADLLLQFWRVCEQAVGKNRLLDAVRQLMGSVSLPPNISQATIDAIPDSPGCYIFYDERRAPLYIGKSIALRSRVMGHFQNALTVRKEMKLSMQVFHIEWIPTCGEMSALILESQLIKERMPSMNIKLRKSKDLCAWQLVADGAGVLKPTLVTHSHLQQSLLGESGQLYGLFYNKKEALGYLSAVAKKHQLCEGLMGLEKNTHGKPCFAFQIKQCQGGGCTEFCVNGLMAGNRRISRSGYDRKHKESSTQRAH